MGRVPDVDRLLGLILLKSFCWRLCVPDVDRLLGLILLKSFLLWLSTGREPSVIPITVK
jgi:hypothetical protein